MKYREAAEALQIPQGTVQSRVHDAVQRLRALLRDEEEVAMTPLSGRATIAREEAVTNAL